uniref:Uncharacterized protein n=1 Tax=Clytia hemisphaerica TaxID=252671 RepID=A0A7M5XLB0_9CNID
RFVQRTLLIPFNEYKHQKLGVIGKLMFSHTLTTEMGPKASALFPQFLELEEVIKLKNIENDPLMKGLEKTLLGKELFHVSDLRSDKNYALMMFFTGKILQRAGLKDESILGMCEFFLDKHLQPFLHAGKKEKVKTKIKESSDKELMERLFQMVINACTKDEGDMYQKKSPSCNCLSLSTSNVNRITGSPFTEGELKRIPGLVLKYELGCQKAESTVKKRLFTGRIKDDGNKEYINCIHLRTELFSNNANMKAKYGINSDSTNNDEATSNQISEEQEQGEEGALKRISEETDDGNEAGEGN